MKRFILAFFSFGFMVASATAQTDDHNLEVKKHLEVFNKAYTQLDLYYVDTLDAKKHLGNALNYLMQSLDPYTEFYKEEQSHELREMSTGKYAGIGSPIYFEPKSKRCVFNSPYPDMPAGKVGLRTGDQILSIDSVDMVQAADESSQEFLSRVTNNLRGEAGSSFTLRVKRPWVADSLLTFVLTRQIIERPSVEFVHLTPDSVGLIKLTSYIESTTREVKRAFVELKQRGMKQFVLDLRGNGGGLMQQAVDLVGLFMPSGTKVLETKGKQEWFNETSHTSDAPLDTDIPIAVLVDGGTASAAEITSGAFQDYDRAVIVGKRTYGKGLVQTSLTLPYNSAIKLTTSKYLIPSGRLIQAYKYEDGEPVYQPDSLAKTFYTRNGRPVKDGGGIMPDVVVSEEGIGEFVFTLMESRHVEDFTVRYRNTHESILPAKDFRLTDAEYEEFCNFIKERRFKPQLRTARLFDMLKDAAHYNKLTDIENSPEWKALYALIVPDVESMLRTNSEHIREMLEIYIVRNYYSDKGVEEYNVTRDNWLSKAIEILKDEAEYKRILGGK